MATIKISTFDSEVLPSRRQLRLKLGDAVVIDFPLTDTQYRDLVTWGDDEVRETFLATKFGKLFEMLAEWEATAASRSLTEEGV